MSTLPPVPPADQPKGIPLWAALVGLLAITLVCLAAVGGVFYYMHRENARLRSQAATLEAEKQRHELERQKGAEADKLTLARNHQNDLLTQTRTATNALEQLLGEVNRLTADADALKTNEEGQRLALHPPLVVQARAFYEKQLPELPATEGIITRLEGARRIEQQVLAQAGTAYEPEAGLTATAQSATAFAQQELQKLAQVRTLLTSLISESKIKYTTAKLSATSPTLGATLQHLGEAEAASARQVLAEKTAEAKEQAVQTLAKAEAQRVIDEANREAAKIRAEAEEKKAEVERELALKKADQQTEDAKTKVKVEQAADEARKVELRKKAADPSVQAKLAPFLTPGYWQLTGTALEKKPLSYTKLVNCGALEPTPKGGSTMATIVSTATDRVRPRWKINPKLYTRYPSEIERIKEAQQLLSELGPILVEMKLLEP